MTPMVFTLLEKPQQQLDLSVVTPDRLARAGKRIAALEARLGGRKTALGDLFRISGSDPQNIELRRTTDKVCRIGYAMSEGSITVKSHGGSLLGENMHGGAIRVGGDCGDWLACDMHGGSIEVAGDAGDYLGNGSHNSIRGMGDGCITVWGNVGDRIGGKMRRGTIIVAGTAGDYTGANMIAGTIIILGKSGNLPGYGMQRGSIILAARPHGIGDTMLSCGRLKMAFLQLLFKQLSSMGGKYLRFKKYRDEAHRYAGDMANAGKGELLVLQK
ncbi:MAG: formylmethanofuran dehydrogenase subunit C [Gammaproteobacteria bacterium]